MLHPYLLPSEFWIAVALILGCLGTLALPFFVYGLSVRLKSMQLQKTFCYLTKMLENNRYKGMLLFQDGVWLSPYLSLSYNLGSFASLEQLESKVPRRVWNYINEKLTLDPYAKVEFKEGFQQWVLEPLSSDNGQRAHALFFEDLESRHLEKENFDIKLKEKDYHIKALRELVNSAPLALWARDDQGAICMINKHYASAVDASEEVILTTHKELVDPQRVISPYALYQKIEQTQKKQKLRTHLVIEGTRRFIELCEAPSSFSFLKSTGYALDLTEIEENEQGLRRHLELHHEVLQQLSTPIAIFSNDTKLTFFNSSFQKLFKFEESWLFNKPTLAELLDDMRTRQKLPEMRDFQIYKKEHIDHFQTLLSPLEELMNLPSGTTLRLIVTPHPMGGLVYLFEDVTNKLALERSYNTLMAVQKETLDHLYEGIVVFGSDHRLRLYNPAFANSWGFDEDLLKEGTHLSALVSFMKKSLKDSPDEFEDNIITMTAQRKPHTFHVSLKYNRILQNTYVPLPDGSHLLGFNDISDSMHFEQALTERNIALETADKLKTDFIQHISYELESPLNTLRGFCEILLNQYFGNLNERQRDYCQGIYDSAERLLSLIHDMVDLASLEAGQLTLQRTTIDLDGFLQALSKLIHQHSNEAGVDYLYEKKVRFSSFEADEKRLKQALLKVISNAIKFTPSRGRVLLTVEETSDMILFSIHDTGMGMSLEEQAKLLSAPGYLSLNLEETVSESNSGLGLSLVKSFIELHGGKMDVFSTLGEGTKITLFLPKKGVG